MEVELASNMEVELASNMEEEQDEIRVARSRLIKTTTKVLMGVEVWWLGSEEGDEVASLNKCGLGAVEIDEEGADLPEMAELAARFSDLDMEMVVVARRGGQAGPELS